MIIMLAILFCAIAGFMNTEKAQAAAKKTVLVTEQKQKIGGRYIWQDWEKGICYADSKTGTEKVLVAKTATGRVVGVVAVGKTLYYGISEFSTDKLKLYQCNINGKNKKQLGTIKHGDSLAYYYGGKLYIECHDVYDGTECDYTYISTYEFNIRTKKTKKIIDNCTVWTAAKNILLGIPNSGDYGPTDLCLYNLKTKKKIRISKEANGSCTTDGKKVYYVDFDNMQKNGYGHYILRSCNVKGKNKKTVVKFKGDTVREVTTKYIIYQKGYGDNSTYYKYTYKTKKTEQIEKPDWFTY